MNHFSFNEIMTEISDLEIPQVAACSRAGNGPLVFSVVYSESNSKRLSISKALASALDLKTNAYLLAIPAKNILLLSKMNIANKAIELKLSGEGKKLVYASPVVTMLINKFKLNYDSCTSKAFKEITLDFMENDVPVAIISMADPTVDMEGSGQ